MSASMPRIRQLDPSIVNKIAAGEVIERPASVVKELLENALDAGARRIDVLVHQGGLDLIRVVDDGCGIAADDLALAVTSHATSKIESADDLFHVQTMGFRGEALASIAEISHLFVRSRPGGEQAGAELYIEGGKSRGVAPASCAPGTTFEVRNLFFNTPVRRKFMRSTATELGHVSEALTRIALAHEGVRFSMNHEERLVTELPPTHSWRDRIRDLCGEEIADALIPVDRSEDGIRIHGFVADPSLSRGNNRLQYLFLNRRFIRDRSLSHALGEAYRGLLLTGRYPIAFLHLEMSPDLVDVNVHPTKLEVRFVDSSRVYSLLLGMLRSRFLSTDLTAKGRAVTGVPASADGSPRPLSGPSHFQEAAPDSTRSHPANLWGADRRAIHASAAQAAADSQRRPPAWTVPQLPDLPVPVGGSTASTEPLAPTRPPDATPSASTLGSPAMQICDRYLVTETQDGMVVMDQHALHERILYEELRTKMAAGGLDRQRLLVPEPVELTAAEAGVVLEHQATLAELGMEVEHFGGTTVLVLSYPAMLANLAPSEMIRKVAAELCDSGGQAERGVLLDDLLHMIACKAAIKAGDRLTAHEITALVDRSYLVQDAHHCPHGRPTTLVFTREELDRQFQRT
ncbi:MAG TPA: DNA mismatch repair endonuclease MutL [Pirellulaceae bacterium]